VDTHLFDYDLPPEAIAQEPSAKRDDARLMVVDRMTGSVSDLDIRDLPYLFDQPYRLVRNNAAVLKARLKFNRSGGGAGECLLLQPAAVEGEWWCLLKPGKRLPEGATFGEAGAFSAVVHEKTPDGMARVAFTVNPGFDGDLIALTEARGQVPLPPYIQRQPDDPRHQLDNERYETVYADPAQRVAVAAPTAGLHFTPELLAKMTLAGHQFHDLTLHVGLGTFRPIQTDSIEAHDMHAEHYVIPTTTRDVLEDVDGPPVLAVGTTSLRASEDYWRYHRQASLAAGAPLAADARLFIWPPSNFRANALLTNFHLPKSTLLCLVSAFLTPDSTDGIAWLKEIYHAALDRGYRFYSYGDAMLIL